MHYILSTSGVYTCYITESYDKKHNIPCAYLAFEANVYVLIVKNVFLLAICNFLFAGVMQWPINSLPTQRIWVFKFCVRV